MRRIYHELIQSRIWFVENIFGLIFRVFPIKKGKIVFINFSGQGYGENPKYLADEFIKQADFELIWLAKRHVSSEFPSGIRVVKYGSLRAMFELSTAEIWINNVRNSKLPFKRERQLYLQTWHGSLAIKKVEKSAIANLSKTYIKSAIRDGRISDGILAASELQVEQMKKNFWLSNQVKILKFGLPRNDVLFNESKKEKISHTIRQYYGIAPNTKIILYAPTFRDGGESKAYALDFKKIINILQEKYKEKFVFIIKFHPNVKIQNVGIKFDEQILNGNEISDIQMLYIAADLMVSDYSSAMMDFTLLKKPIFIFANDISEYNKSRGLSPEFDQLPFPRATTNQELIFYLLGFQKKSYWNGVDDFFSREKMFDKGESSKLIYKWILDNSKLK